MPTWVSRDGVWEPAKEKVALVYPKGHPKEGEPYVYEGPDRAALEQNKEEGVGTRGTHFMQDTEWINRVRQLHNMSMKEYCDMMGYDEKTTKETFEKNISKTNLHPEPVRKAKTRFSSGGKNTAGDGHLEGDFGEPKAEFKTK